MRNDDFINKMKDLASTELASARQREEELLSPRIQELTEIAQEYGCAIVNLRTTVWVFRRGQPIHHFTRAHILFSNVPVREYFLYEMEDKL